MATKLVIKTSDAPNIPGGKALMLYDQDGCLIPNQAAIVHRNAVGELAEVTVTFYVDGDNVRLEDG